MKHHSFALTEMLGIAKQNGCRIEENGNTVKIYPSDKSLPLYTLHKSERGLHPLRRYLKNTCKFELN